MAPQHNVGPRTKTQAAGAQEVSHDRVCFNSPTSQIGGLSRSKYGLFNQSWSSNPKWEQGRERLGEEGGLKRIGKFVATRNLDVRLTAITVPSHPLRRGTDPRSRDCTAVTSTFPPDGVASKAQFLDVRYVRRSVQRKHARGDHLIDCFRSMIGHNVTSTRDLVFFVSPGSLSLVARRVLSLVEQSDDLLDLHRALVVHGALRGRHNLRRSRLLPRRRLISLHAIVHQRRHPVQRRTPALHLGRVDLDLSILWIILLQPDKGPLDDHSPPHRQETRQVARRRLLCTLPRNVDLVHDLQK
ncbi:hypothetical protein NW759_016674 [Fusarium solani]|nr:hypothetical protein NW759_016674 [Fusarium solani]